MFSSMKLLEPHKRKTFVMSKLMAKFRMAGQPKPTGGSKKKRKPKPKLYPKPKWAGGGKRR